jgi:hypothetical protein
VTPSTTVSPTVSPVATSSPLPSPGALSLAAGSTFGPNGAGAACTSLTLVLAGGSGGKSRVGSGGRGAVVSITSATDGVTPVSIAAIGKPGASNTGTGSGGGGATALYVGGSLLAVAAGLLQSDLRDAGLGDVQRSHPGAFIVTMGRRLSGGSTARAARGLGVVALGDPQGRPAASHSSEAKGAGLLLLALGLKAPKEQVQRLGVGALAHS